MHERQKVTAEPDQLGIRDALQRILASNPFKRSPTLSRFLGHVVAHALHTDDPPLKEYAIGVEVFERAEDFDPRLDTIVRVQARRLRAALAKYYRNDGRHDSVRIAMPKGHYGIHAYFAEPSQNTGSTSKDEPQTSRTRRQRTAWPAARTDLVGRSSELAQLAKTLLDSNTRILTITGVGGVGKTRMALAVAERIRDDFPGGAAFLDVASITESRVLTGMLADLFDVQRTGGRPLEQALFERLQETLQQPFLLVLDNIEDVTRAEDLLAGLLDSSAQITVLATSRKPMNLYGEFEFPLAPLAVPERGVKHEASQLAQVPSVKLFLARATAANPRGDLLRDRQSLAELCLRLDGIPLAIELVAAQSGSMTPSEMLERFSGHLDLPQNPARDAPCRQLTMRRVIDSSYEFLDEPARMALRRLSVFAGGFHLDAAEAVADAAGDLGAELLPAINRLVAMGLVYYRGDEDGSRFSMLDILRKYGLERLNANPEADSIRKAHAAYYVVLAEEGVGNLDPKPREGWLARCDNEQDNFRQAIHYLLKRGPHGWALRLGHALFLYWERREKIPEARQLLDSIIDTVPVDADPALWAKVASYAATLAGFQGDIVASGKIFSDVLALYGKLGDRRGEASVLNALAINARLRGDESLAYEKFLQGLEICRQIGEPAAIAAALSNLAECSLRMGKRQGVLELLEEAHDLFVQEKCLKPAAWCINHMGDLARVDGDIDLAERHYRRAEAGFQQLEDSWGLARSVADRGQLAIDRGDYAAAVPLLLDAMAGFSLLKHQRGLAKVAERMAGLALAVGDPERVIRLLAAARGWRKAVGYTAGFDDLEHAEDLRKQALAGLDKKTIEALENEGLQMSAADVTASFESLLNAIQPGGKVKSRD